MKNNAILITGGAGFIGSHLCEHYLSVGATVIAVDNFSTGMRANVEYLKKLTTPDKFIFIESDVVRPWDWSKNLGPDLLKKICYVYHFASPASPPLYQDLAFDTLWVNSVGLRNALEFSDSVGARLIFASTSEVYGDPSISPQPESYWGNVNSFGVRSCYDESKRFGEALIFTHNWKKKTKHGLVRIFNTYGPRMNPTDGRVVINFLVQARDGKNLTVYGDGKQSRSFCYITDLISGITSYADKDITEPVNLGNDKEFTVLELAHIVQKMTTAHKCEIEFKKLPQDDPMQRKPDLTKSKKLIAPWVPKVTLEEGLLKMREWLSQ